MSQQMQSCVAAIHNVKGNIVGTGFAIDKGYVVTCAHVILDAVGLSKPAPEQAPKAALSLRFRFIEGHPAYDAVIAPGGWFPGNSHNPNIGALRDIAVLSPKDPNTVFPVGPGLLPLGWHGGGSCLGFPEQRNGLHRDIKGHVAEREETDGWLNFHPTSDLDRADLGGMSGSPAFRSGVLGIAGMLSGKWRDDELFVRIIPAKAIVEAVAQAEGRKTGIRGRDELFRGDARAKAMKTAADGWLEVGATPPTPETIRALCDTLLEAASPKANNLPESFPYRYLERRIYNLKKLTQREWPPAIPATGEFIVDLADFISVLSSLPHEMGAPISACDAAGKALGFTLDTAGQSSRSLCWNASDARWPLGTDTQVKRQVEQLLREVAPLAETPNYQPQAQLIEDNAEAILAETERNPPHWTRLKGNVAAITATTEKLNKAGASPDVSAAASDLKYALAAASEAAILGLAPLKRFQELSFAPEMIVVPPGRFEMGITEDTEERDNEGGGRHEVVIPRSFAVGRYPVTLGEYAEFERQTGHREAFRDQPALAHPVVQVSWKGAQAYIRWLNSFVGAGRYRLLSEAEWEYCCRAGTQTPYAFGHEFREDRAHRADTSTKVGSFPINDFGLYDMHGNVWEWCEDEWHISYSDKPDGLKHNGAAWIGGGDDSRVIRGGSWGGDPWSLRAATRDRHAPSDRDEDIGFRLARTL